MAKTLIAGHTITTDRGDVWDAAILTSDFQELNFLDQTFRFRVDIYKDAAARTAKDNPLPRWYDIDKPTFQANFDMNAAATTLKAQSEDYALLLEDAEGNLIYGDDFE